MTARRKIVHEEGAMASMWDSVSVDGGTMKLYLSIPHGAGPFPAVVVIQHQGGVDELVEEMTDRVGAAGHVGVAPDLYHRVVAAR